MRVDDVSGVWELDESAAREEMHSMSLAAVWPNNMHEHYPAWS